MPPPRSQLAGFTLVELMIVISIMGILAGLLIPNFLPQMTQQLKSGADTVAADLSFARELAVANNTSYEITFDAENNFYRLTHTGSDLWFDKLPELPFGEYNANLTELTVHLDKLPHLGGKLRLSTVHTAPDSGSRQTVDQLEFGPLGETTRAEPTLVWLAMGQGQAQAFVPLRVDPITGLVTVGEVTNVSPIARAAKAIAAGL